MNSAPARTGGRPALSLTRLAAALYLNGQLKESTGYSRRIFWILRSQDIDLGHLGRARPRPGESRERLPDWDVGCCKIVSPRDVSAGTGGGRDRRILGNPDEVQSVPALFPRIP
jgi:hypothetical protein